jgi:hypothetical protein
MVDLKIVSQHDLWYIVGFIATDGNLSKDGRHINITSKDKSHLFKIKKSLHLKSKIGTKARGGSKLKNYYYLAFGDIKFYKYLMSIGLFAKKSCILKSINVPDKFFCDFLRGVIDGDGCISTWINKNNKYHQWSIRITSAASQFINWLKEKTERLLLIKGRLYSCIRQNKNPIYILKFGKLPMKIIINNIYKDKNCLKLERKARQARRCLQDKNKMLNYLDIVSPGAVIGSQPRLKIGWE